MKRTVNIGLINYHEFRHRQRLTITVELTDSERGSVLSITGQIGKYSFGQIDDEIADNIHRIEYAKGWDRTRLIELLQVWGDWHLNNMNAGTPAQKNIVRSWRKTVSYPNDDYTAQCAELERHGLLVDDGYKYGTAWLFHPLPVDIEAKMRNLINQQ